MYILFMGKIKEKISAMELGETFKYGGLQWCKLDNMEDGSLCCTEKPVGWNQFGFDNNWLYSTIRNTLQTKLLNDIIKYGGEKKDFLLFFSDLTSADGLDDYGVVEDTISILSDDMYRKYRKLLTPTNRPFWTLTPHSTTPQNKTMCHYVTTMGDIDKIYSNWLQIFVRPVCMFADSTLGILKKEAI